MESADENWYLIVRMAGAQHNNFVMRIVVMKPEENQLADICSTSLFRFFLTHLITMKMCNVCVSVSTILYNF